MYLLEIGEDGAGVVRFHRFGSQASAEEFLHVERGHLDGYWDRWISVRTADGSLWSPFDSPYLPVIDHTETAS